MTSAATRNSSVNFRLGRRLNRRSCNPPTHKEHRDGKDRDQPERIARRSRSGPDRRGGLPASAAGSASTARPTMRRGPRSGSRRRGAPRPCLMGRRSDEYFADAMAVAHRRVGRPAQRPAQVRRVVELERRRAGATRRCSGATWSRRSPGSSASWTVTSSSSPAVSSCTR